MSESQTATIGHNSNTGGIAVDRLRNYIGRIERLEEERKALGADIKDIYQEVKSAGFDTKVVRWFRISKTLANQTKKKVSDAGKPQVNFSSMDCAVKRLNGGN